MATDNNIFEPCWLLFSAVFDFTV